MVKKTLFFILISLNIICLDIYNYDTCILTNYKNFELSQEVKNIAFNSNRSLGLSKFFDTSKIVDNIWVKNELQKDRTHQELIAQTSDNKTIEFSYFNRGSDTLILIGPGFTNSKEKMVPFVHMFLDYDIAILNFRGHGHSEWRFSPLYHLTGIDSNIQLGASEENDVFAVIETLTKNKKYKKIIGLGICFGAFIFVKAEAIAKEKNLKLFDKLILDGCWLSLDLAKEKIFNDPYLIISPQHGGAPDYLKYIFQNKVFKNSLEWCVESACSIKFAHISLEKYLKEIKIPVLIFQGKNDLMISRSEFEEIWNNLETEKIAIITNNPHVHNHLRSKELYKLVCDMFMEENFSNFINILSDYKKLNETLITKTKSFHKKDIKDFLKPITVKNKKHFPYWTLLLIVPVIYGIKKFKDR